MKNKVLFLFIFLLTLMGNAFTQDDSYTIQKLLIGIRKPQAPLVKNGYVIFTFDATPQKVGIAFEFEDFTKVHRFEKIINHDTNEEIEVPVLFYILKIPEKTQNICYKLIVDGLWTLDPLNDNTKYNYETNLTFSNIPINAKEKQITETTNNNLIRFVYQGKPGERIRLSGSFTNWDSFIYEMSETSPGLYELSIPLKRGTHYYTYYNGTDSFIDKQNPNKMYTLDGRKVSVITLN